MTRRLSRIAPVALAIAAVAVPSAQARPAEVGDPGFLDTRPVPIHVDKVTPDARDAARPAALPGPPTWPVDPVPISQASPPVVADDGFDWSDAGLGAAGFAALLALAGGTTVLTRRHMIRAS